MACSRFEYVKSFERHDALLPSCWVVLRVDGKGFTKFAAAHGFEKPNDARALAVMNDAAVAVLDALPDVVLAYGQVRGCPKEGRARGRGAARAKQGVLRTRRQETTCLSIVASRSTKHCLGARAVRGHACVLAGLQSILMPQP